MYYDHALIRIEYNAEDHLQQCKPTPLWAEMHVLSIEEVRQSVLLALLAFYTHIKPLTRGSANLKIGVDKTLVSNCLPVFKKAD